MGLCLLKQKLGSLWTAKASYTAAGVLLHLHLYRRSCALDIGAAMSGGSLDISGRHG